MTTLSHLVRGPAGCFRRSFMKSKWEFWIDVGGTFTDCVARRPDGRLARHKLLSSGVTKGIVGAASSVNESGAATIADPALGRAPVGFWNGFRFRLLDEQGAAIFESTVERCDRAISTLKLSPPLAAPPQPGQAYELIAGEEAPVLAIRWLLDLAADEPIPPVAVRLGTTRGTNALLTRGGAKTALVTTRGFGDILGDRLSESARVCSSWRFASRRRCTRPSSKSTSASPPTARCSSRPIRAKSASNSGGSRSEGSNRWRFACSTASLIRPTSGSSPRSLAKPAFARSACRTKSRRW